MQDQNIDSEIVSFGQRSAAIILHCLFYLLSREFIHIFIIVTKLRLLLYNWIMMLRKIW